MVNVGRSCQPIAAVFNRQILNFGLEGIPTLRPID